ncbi:MAG: phosphoenolpyruvate--protein phosphotransferase, partial [Deltaproteobacteria bacterium]|nr:phosphoenolpyruvate--protein phosphotransferase [Deltaproteobacteria bacterium]
RTLDIGGDKFLPFQEIAHEMNPFMGWRSIRISLKEKNHFIKQIKAILRTSAIGKVKILFPMVSSIDEFREAKKLVERAKKELQKEGKAFDPNIQLGIMVEVPSIGVMANLIIKEVDFLSIGSNDLIQFMLAVDRNNEKVAPFYQPLNPAVIHIIHEVIKAGIKAKKPVSLCGEMAGESFYAPLLFGLGLRVFSMNPHSIPKVKKVLISLKTGETQELAEEALKKTTHEEIYNLLEKFNRIRRIN